MKNLSSPTTVFHTEILPVFFTLMPAYIFWLIITGQMHGKYEEPPIWYAKWLVLGGGVLAGSYAIFAARRMFDVEMDDTKIRVSRYWTSDDILLSNVISIDETWLTRPKMIVVRLRSPSKFGRTIRFIPEGRKWFWSTHPIVSELRAAVEKTVRNE